MANVFLDEDEVFPIGARASVFGRQGGNEGVTIQPGVQDVTLDANMERIDLAQSAGDASLQATGNGLEIRDSGGNTVVSVASFNQDADVRFTDGNVTVRQSGATEFTVEGSDGSTQTVDTQSSAGVSVPLGGETSNSGDGSTGSGGTSSETVDINANTTGPFDATGADVTYNLASGTYTAEIGNFANGDELRPFDGASITVENDSDLSDGEKTVTFADAATGATATLVLTGLTSTQDTNLFNRGSFNDVFGDGTLPPVDDSSGSGSGSEPGSGSGGESGSGSGGQDDGISGDVLVDGAAATSIPTGAGTLTVGASGSGSADLGDGQERTFTSDTFDNVEIAAQSGSSGSLSLDGADTDIVTAGTDNTVQVGRRGEGDLTVENGAGVSTLQFEVGRRGDGSATIRGQDSKVTASNDNGLFSGEFSSTAGFVRAASKPGSSGTIEIRDGAELEIRPGSNQNSDTSGPGINIGEEVGSNGDIIVDGQGSEIDIRQSSPIKDFGPYLTVGDALGQGDLTVRNGGQISLEGPRAFLNVSEADAGEANDTSDTSAVEQSTLTIESGGQVSLTADTQSAIGEFGPLADSNASITVSGQGSLLTFNSTGNGSGVFDVGMAGTTDLTIENGGRVEAVYAGAGGDYVPDGGSLSDYRTGGTGNITVDGSDSELVLEGTGGNGFGGFLTIGRSGTGSLDVTNGGTVSISSQQGTFPGLEVGDSPIADGTATISGQGSSISISGEQGSVGDGGYAGYIAVGNNNGTGSMTVENGASVTNDESGTTFVGNDGANSDGTLTITGSGTSFDAGARLVIGGTFDFNAGQLDLSADGTGSVTVEDGATLTAGQDGGDDDIFVGNNGSLQVANGASLTGDVQTDNGGVFAMGSSPGLAIVQGDFDAGGETVFELDGTADGAFDRIDVAGDATLGGDVTFDVGGGFTPEAGDAFTIVEADGAVALAGDLDVGVAGLPDDLGIDLDAGGGAIVATVVDSGDPDALA